jgi:pimeloyl-ACP methyl ester carboxylesterase
MRAYPIHPIERPSLALFGIEPWRAAWEFAAHQLAGDAAPADGDGHPVAPLRRYCTGRGYAARDWGLGRNLGPQGDAAAWMSALRTHTEGLLGASPCSATLIDWSLGGLYARELAKTMGPRVRQVITVGTPFNAPADPTPGPVDWLLRLIGGPHPPFGQALGGRLRDAPLVPATSIYSLSDGMVAWQACRHVVESHRVHDVEVHGSHAGLGWNRAVLHVVGDRLAQEPGRWLRYAPATVRSKAG